MSFFSFAALSRVVVRIESRGIIFRGKTTIITCFSYAKPRPILTWLKNGKKISNGGRVTIFSYLGLFERSWDSDIVITDTNFKDSGVYTCVVDNVVVWTNRSVILLVHGMFGELKY